MVSASLAKPILCQFKLVDREEGDALLVVGYPPLPLLLINVGVDDLLARQQNPTIASLLHISRGLLLLDLRFEIGDDAIQPLEFLREGRTSRVVGGLAGPVEQCGGRRRSVGCG